MAASSITIWNPSPYMTLICPSKTIGKAVFNCSVSDKEVPTVAALTFTKVGSMEAGTVGVGLGS